MYSATLEGFACTFLLGRAGEPIRPILIARKASLSIPGMFGVYVLERVFDMAAAALLLVAALLSFERGGFAGAADAGLMKVARSAGVALLVALLAVMAFLVYFRYHGAAWLARKLQHQKWHTGWREKLAALLEGFSEGLQGIRSWSDLAAVTGYTILHWVLVVFDLSMDRARVWRESRVAEFWRGGTGYSLYARWFGGSTSWSGRRVAARYFPCPYSGVWSRKRAGGGGIDCDLADHVCGVLLGGIAIAVSGRLVDGRTAENGARGGTGGRSSTTGRRGACRRAKRESAVKCPFCSHLDDKVIDSREARTGDLIRRRRECLKCNRRFTTYERIDEIPYMVIKKDGRREKFERQKILQGLLKACEKRPVPVGKLETIVDQAEAFVSESSDRERTTTEIGELLMAQLKKLDKVAYVRFASVYSDFKDVKEFMDELKGLLKDRAKR